MLTRVLCTYEQNLAYEIILTLGQAFEVAYQLALQARKGGHGSSTLPESFDSKPSKPIPKPRSNIRKSVSARHTLAHTSCSSVPLHFSTCPHVLTLWLTSSTKGYRNVFSVLLINFGCKCEGNLYDQNVKIFLTNKRLHAGVVVCTITVN